VQLTVLDLRSNNLSGHRTSELCEGLSRTPLRRLLLANCKLDSHACSGLAFLLDNSLALQHLDIVRFATELSMEYTLSME
jgi:hypothetical protein